MELTNFLKRLAALLLLVALVQHLTGCAASADLPTVLSRPVDSSIQHQLARQFNVQHLKIKGNVTVQLGTGNSNTDATRARGQVASGQGKAQDLSHTGRGSALATEPGASAGATTRTGVPAWLLGLGAIVVVLLLLLGRALKKRAWPVA